MQQRTESPGLDRRQPMHPEQQRIKLIDNYIMYCRKSKLPHLYNYLPNPHRIGAEPLSTQEATPQNADKSPPASLQQSCLDV